MSYPPRVFYHFLPFYLIFAFSPSPSPSVLIRCFISLFSNSELRLAEAKLSSTEKELESLSVERLKHGANVYRWGSERKTENMERRRESMCTIHSSKSSYSLFEYFVYVLQHMKVHYAVVLEVGRDCRPHLSKLCSIIPPFLHPSLPFSILYSFSQSFTPRQHTPYISPAISTTPKKSRPSLSYLLHTFLLFFSPSGRDSQKNWNRRSMVLYVPHLMSGERH